LVLTQPDRPAGRGLHTAQSAVKRRALERGLELFQPPTLKSDGVLERVRLTQSDALVVAAYGLILPQAMLEAAPRGALNIHASLLPRWRGAAPIQRALLAGDAKTGISIMQMDCGLDTGPVFAQRSIVITDDEDAGSLHDKLAELGAEMIVQALADLKTGKGRFVPQPAEGITYAHKLNKKDTVLDWTNPATQLERAVRAFRPAPGAATCLGAEPIKIWRARVVPGQGKPGEILRAAEEIVVACRTESLAISELQRAGGKRVTAAEFLSGHPLVPGNAFGAAAL
jgi:methionyl-tRNA formyltransferase